MSIFQYYNPNPLNKLVGDCVIRALTIALNMSWSEAYTELCAYGMLHGDIPSSNSLWGAFLKEKGFRAKSLPNECPDCYTVYDFVKDHPVGTFLLSTGTHLVAAKDGMIFDTWNSSGEVVAYYFERA